MVRAELYALHAPRHVSPFHSSAAHASPSFVAATHLYDASSALFTLSSGTREVLKDSLRCSALAPSAMAASTSSAKVTTAEVWVALKPACCAKLRLYEQKSSWMAERASPL